MKCFHGKDEREECQACAAAWKAQHGTTYWRKTSSCPHKALPNARGYREPMAATLVDDTSGRTLVGGCVDCKTALPAPRVRR